ncbi:hypothetical protein [Streptomyces sp. NPDC006477]|uniref:hypothetical protein n=1 Tax=Streptomyces sp. NPDC006477 TaxID=3364747 RepID=UPI0036A73864
MAHKLKVKPVPHINRDGAESATKKDYVVRCKRRGHVCVEKTFTSKRDAENFVAEHWVFVNRRKTALIEYPSSQSRSVLGSVQNFQWYLDRRFRNMRRLRESGAIMNTTSTAKSDELTGAAAA